MAPVNHFPFLTDTLRFTEFKLLNFKLRNFKRSKKKKKIETFFKGRPHPSLRLDEDGGRILMGEAAVLWPIRFQCGGIWIVTDPLQMYVGDHTYTAFRLVQFHHELKSCKSRWGGGFIYYIRNFDVRAEINITFNMSCLFHLQLSASETSICPQSFVLRSHHHHHHGVGPFVDPFRSHTFRTLFNGRFCYL